jgi:alpha-tubulin suppressor-like RCC1 family protein
MMRTARKIRTLAASGALALLVASGAAHADATAPRLSAGGFHACARISDGTLWCWGYNAGGQLGDGTFTDKRAPWQVMAAGNTTVEVATGYDHTCVRKSDGTLWCWGLNTGGELGSGPSANQNLPVQVTALGTSVAGVSAGDEHTCARKGDGTAWCWGVNGNGQLGAGNNLNASTPVQVTGGGSYAEISAGGYHTCGRKTDGTLWCWGRNNVGQLGDGSTTDKNAPVQVTALGSSVAEVSAGEDNTCARKTDGTLWCWGWNKYGNLGDGTTDDSSTPVWVETLGTQVVEVSTGSDFACARKADFSLWCWGFAGDGQLGNGVNIIKVIPTEVTALGHGVTEVSAGLHFTCARNFYGATWCWGSNITGQLGIGSLTNSSIPVQVSSFASAPQVPASRRLGEAALALGLLAIATRVRRGSARHLKQLG